MKNNKAKIVANAKETPSSKSATKPSNKAAKVEVTTGTLNVPTLKCLVTGKTRITTQNYLETKDPQFAKFYISREVQKLLRTGKTVQEIRTSLKVGSDVSTPEDAQIRKALKLNGKQSKAPAEKSTTKTSEKKEEVAA